MDYSPSSFARCAALNNEGVRKFLRERNVDEACKLFRQALCIVSKQGTKWLRNNPRRVGVKAGHMDTARLGKATQHPPSAHRSESKLQQRGDDGQIYGQGINKNTGPCLRKCWDSISRARPVRLETSYTARDAPHPLHWRLATTVVAFNLALTYHILAFTGSPQAAPKRCKAAYALFELACTLRLAVVTKKGFKGDTLAELDSLIVRTAINLHSHHHTSPSQNSSVRKLGSYVNLVASSLIDKKQQGSLLGTL